MIGGFSLARVVAMLGKEFIQMRRDRLTLGMLIGIPLMQLFLFGYAINTEVKHLPTIVFDQSLQQDSRDLLTALTASEYFDIQYVARSFQEVNAAVDDGFDAFMVPKVVPSDADDSKLGFEVRWNGYAKLAGSDKIVEIDTTSPADGEVIYTLNEWSKQDPENKHVRYAEFDLAMWRLHQELVQRGHVAP